MAVFSILGDALRKVGVFSSVGDMMSTVGVIFSTVGILSTMGDIMMHVRDIISTTEGVQCCELSLESGGALIKTFKPFRRI